MRKNFLIISLIAIIIPLSCRAFFLDDFFRDFDKKLFFDDFEKGSSTQVINEVNVSANTGGNTVEEGKINEGEGKINVEIKNIINGESIEPIDIETEANKVEVKSRIEVKGDGSEPIVEREIIIDDEKIDNEKKEEKEWLPNFMEEIKNFFQSIFKFFK